MPRNQIEKILQNIRKDLEKTIKLHVRTFKFLFPQICGLLYTYKMTRLKYMYYTRPLKFALFRGIYAVVINPLL